MYLFFITIYTAFVFVDSNSSIWVIIQNWTHMNSFLTMTNTITVQIIDLSSWITLSIM
jgi:hypothetical protein